MATKIIFVTGTDTDIGKTVNAAQLTRQWRKSGANVVALKPVCSGGRSDARILRKAAGSVLSLDEVNPWYFRAALSPLLAARRERKELRLAQVVRHIQSVAKRFEVVIVEGAGGLLSPLGEDFDSRDLIVTLKAVPIIVAPNRLGAVNQVLLVLNALPRKIAKRAQIILVNPPRPDAASQTNGRLLREKIASDIVHEIPWDTRLKRA